MKKYLFIIKNSFLENNLHPISTFFKILEPLFELTGFIFLYSYLENNKAGLDQKIIVYFITVFAISSVTPKGVMAFIKKDIKDEKFLTLNQRPINPFLYYFSLNLGKNLISLSLGLALGVFTLVYYRYPLTGIAVFIPTVLSAIVLLNVIYFWLGALRFRLKYFNNSLYNVLIQFLSGRLIPITLFPIVFLTIMKFLPFIYASGQIAKDISERDLQHLSLSVLVLLIWIFIIGRLSVKSWFSGSNYYQEKM